MYDYKSPPLLKEDIQDFGQTVKRCRESAEPKVSQKRLAELIGVSLNTYRKMEEGEISFPMESVIKIGQYLSIDVSLSIGGKNYAYFPQED